MRNPYRDSETGFYEFQLFRELFQREVDRSRRYARPLSLLVGCWSLEANEAHLPMDAVLLWSSLARDVDFSARMSPGRLLTVLPETDRPGASVTAERFVRAFAKGPGSGLQAQPRLGVVTYPLQGRTVDELLINAEIQADRSTLGNMKGRAVGAIAVGSRA